MSIEPSMSMCANVSDYMEKTVDYQRERIEELEKRLVALQGVAKEAYWHAYEYARMNPDYNHILPVWNRFKLGHPELDQSNSQPL